MWGKSFKCMIKGDKLNQSMHTTGHILSPSSCTHFSLSDMKLPWKDLLHHAAKMLNPLMWCGWSCKTWKISHHIFVFKFILLSIFYSSLLYHSTNVIMLLDSFSHVAEMLRPTDVIWLELQSLKVAEMLSPLMLQLELQNMKISHYILSSNLYY